MSDPEMRKVLGSTLTEVMGRDDRVVVVNADLAGALGTATVKKSFPQRYYDVGIQEANMVSFGAGMSTCGYIPLVVSFTAFTARRAADQLMVSCAFARRPVKVIGGDPGVSAQLNGGTHMSFEDVAIMRSMAGFKVVEPADAESLRILLPQVIDDPAPVYLRLFRKQRPSVYGPTADLRLGKAVVLREGTDVTLVASGVEVHEALRAADALATRGVRAEVIDVHTVKPLDEETILASARKTGAVVTCENASVVGGLGDAVSEALSGAVPVPLVRIGVKNEIGEVGDLDYLLDRFELSAEWITRAADKVLAVVH